MATEDDVEISHRATPRRSGGRRSTSRDRANAVVVGPVELVADHDAPARARRLLAELDVSWSVDSREVAQVLISEAVTNVVRHTACPVLHVLVGTRSGHLRIEVEDCDSEHYPFIAPLRPSEPGGVGLRLIDQMSTSWGVFDTEAGKCVWFEVDADVVGG